MRVSQYVRAERAIDAADKSGIRERWVYGLRLLNDPDAMSAGGGGLRHGVADQLVAAAQSRGIALSQREIRFRIQCARAYPTEAQIGTASSDFASWTDLRSAGFPAIERPEGEPDADWRTTEEKRRDAARRMADLVGDQAGLFPLDHVDPGESTVKELRAYAIDQRDLTARFAERDRKRFEYLGALDAATGGDDSAVWQDAHRLAFPGEDVL